MGLALMEFALIALTGIVGWLLLGHGINPMAKNGFAPDTGFRRRVRDIIQGVDTKGINKELLWVLSDLETGGGYSEKGLQTFAATNSLFNRHKGSGKGFWTGLTYYAGPRDTDLRVYSSPGQSVEDIVQLLHDPLYSLALAGALSHDYKLFFHGLAVAGYSTQSDYELALNGRGRQMGVTV